MGIFGWSYPPGCSGTPYDDEPDPYEEAERFIKDHNDGKHKDIDSAQISETAFYVIQGLIDVLDENGLWK